MTTDHGPRTTDSPRWLHRWAVLTVCATFVLLGLGAVVTTRNAGMADPIWPTYPWHLLLISWEEPRPGFLIEHSHRAAGYVVGCCIIVLTVGLWLKEPRRWLCWLGTAALAGVIVQGLLGGFRVVLDQLMGDNLKLIHGVFAQVMFAFLVSLALFTSRGWATGYEETFAAPRFRLLCLLTTLLIFVQIVFGAMLRHWHSSLAQRGHLLLASAVAAAAACVAWEIFSRWPRERRLTIPAVHLVLFVVLQLLLGVEAWMAKYMEYTTPAHQVAVRTAHVLTGSLILATSVVITLRAYGQVAWAVRPATAAPGRLEGVL
jgi:heme a synthase